MSTLSKLRHSSAAVKPLLATKNTVVLAEM